MRYLKVISVVFTVAILTSPLWQAHGRKISARVFQTVGMRSKASGKIEKDAYAETSGAEYAKTMVR